MKRTENRMLEDKIAKLKAKWELSSIHLFFDDSYPGLWRVFGARKTVEGFSKSVTEGLGITIASSVDDLDINLSIGPIKASERIAFAKAQRPLGPEGLPERVASG